MPTRTDGRAVRAACAAAAGWLWAGSPAPAQPVPEPVAATRAAQAANAPTPPPGAPLGLGECIAVALDRQPAVKAARLSLRAAEAGQQALTNLGPLAGLLSRDVPFRREQSARGVAVARAEVQKVHNESVYDVTRLYWAYVYARQQESTANDVIVQLEVFEKVLEDILREGVPDPKGKVNVFSLYNLRAVISEVRRLRVTAVIGQEQALAALREAMGTEDGFRFHPKDTVMPVMAGTISQDQAVEFAVSRRPEIGEAAAAADAFRLEVCAQDAVRLRQSVPTLAAGADLHSKPVPMSNRNGEYKPGAVPPELPTSLVGKHDDRVARAAAYSARQDAVYEKAVSLVRLEATNAYLGWRSAMLRMAESKRNLENARQAVDQARQATAVRNDPELVVRNEGLAGRAQAEYLEAVFEHLKALATLERVTAGGVRPGFPGR